MDIDEVYVQIGEFGFQQKIYFFALSLFNFYAPFHLLQVVFTGHAANFTCLTKDDTIHDNECPNNNINACVKIDFAHPSESFISEWSLVCSESYKAKMVQSLFMLGVMTGALSIGPFADAYGRRITLLVTLIGMITCGVSGSFVTNFMLYLALRFTAGFFSAGNILASFTMATEFVGGSKRGLCGNVYMIFFSVGIIVYSLLAWVLPNWRLLSLVATSSGLLYLVVFTFIPESPRWLITHDRSREARNILKVIAERNNTFLPPDLEISVPVPNAKKGSILDIFRHRRSLAYTLIQIYSWFVNSAVYYGLTLASDQLGSNLYISTMLSGLVEIPAYFITAIFIELIGRRLPLALFMIIGAIACLLIQFLQGLPQIVVILALLGKLSIAASFSIIYIHTTELFPTVIRNSGLGLCSCFARIGGIVAPFFSVVNTISPSLQFTIFGFLSISSGMLNLFLPETLNKTLPETLDDLNSDEEGIVRQHERGRYARIGSLDDDSEEEEEYSRIGT